MRSMDEKGNRLYDAPMKKHDTPIPSKMAYSGLL
ncbi:MAG: hypothetical protein K0Q64_1577 [Nitrobacter vulgaris]|jgi:hypothetical protein|nr:hypothetical protein [Nitrobacter vulgaris]